MMLTREEIELLASIIWQDNENEMLYQKLKSVLEEHIPFISIEKEQRETEFIEAHDIKESDKIIFSGFDYEILQIKIDAPKHHATQYISGLVRIHFKNETYVKKYRWTEKIEIEKRKV